MTPYIILLCVTGALTPIALMVAGVPFLTAVRFTLTVHLMTAFMYAVLIMANLL